MSDRPEDSPEERRRTGPLGDNAETRSEPPPESDAGETRPIPARDSERTEEEESARETERSARRPAAEKETRVIRTPRSGTASQEATPYPRGYFEAAEEREDRLRDMYGGVDWLASFLGFVFAAIVGALFSLIAGLVLAPLGFSFNLGGEIGAAVITGLVLVAVLVFLAYFFGGYVAGRLARFDGGRNGAMLLLWTFLAVLLIVLAGGVFSGLLPPGLSASLRDFIQDGVINTLDNLSRVGVVGVVIVVGALLVALLGGVLGGRMGSRYHAEIDRTS